MTNTIILIILFNGVLLIIFGVIIWLVSNVKEKNDDKNSVLKMTKEDKHLP
jgi:hypothetical protein